MLLHVKLKRKDLLKSFGHTLFGHKISCYDEGSTSLVFCFLRSSSAVCYLLIPTQRLLELAYEKILYKTGVLSLGTMQLVISLTMPPSSELMIDWVS